MVNTAYGQYLWETHTQKSHKTCQRVNQGANTDSSDINYLQQTDWQKQLQAGRGNGSGNGKWETKLG